MKLLLVVLLIVSIGLSGCGKEEDIKQDFTISASPNMDTSQAIPLFKTLMGHCPGTDKYKNDIERVEYLGGSSFDLIISQHPKVIPLDDRPMGHTCHFQVDESKATVGKRPCAWLCTGEKMTGIDGEEHSYRNGKLIGPLKRAWANLREAVAGTRFEMSDIQGGDLSPGAAKLALWGAEHLLWNELQEIPSTKYGLVMKDPDAQRGQKLCVNGQVIEIEVDQSVPGKKVFLGGMFDDDSRIYRFVAVQSTGEIMANTHTRFCGIVTGQQHYPNSMGGVAHAVHLVGMFDIPENKNK